MFKKIIEFFKCSEVLQEQRFTEFLEFYSEAVSSFPESLRKMLRCRDKVRPVILRGKQDDAFKSWCLDFTIKDVYWWKEMNKLHKPLMKTVDCIKHEVMEKCLDYLEDLDEDSMDKVTKEFYNNLLKDLLGKK